MKNIFNNHILNFFPLNTIEIKVYFFNYSFKKKVNLTQQIKLTIILKIPNQNITETLGFSEHVETLLDIFEN